MYIYIYIGISLSLSLSISLSLYIYIYTHIYIHTCYTSPWYASGEMYSFVPTMSSEEDFELDRILRYSHVVGGLSLVLGSHDHGVISPHAGWRQAFLQRAHTNTHTHTS